MSTEAPIIIKKIKKGGGHGHHGGAWKVAYADFVTAMMAFFLLMWLLNSTSEEQKRGLSNYFGPYGNAQGAAGSGGVLGGLSIQSQGMWTDNKTSPSITTPTSEHQEVGVGEDIGGELEEDGTPNEIKDTESTEGSVDIQESQNLVGLDSGQEIQAIQGMQDNQKGLDQGSQNGGQIDDTQEKMAREAELEAQEEKAFAEVQESLKQAIESVPDLKELAENLIVDTTPEGLRIQIVDQKGVSMFPIGSSKMHPHMRSLLQQVGKIVLNMPNKLSISGHTDAKPYANQKTYSNWELSSDRANATRRIIRESGLPPERIYSVVGKSDTEPLIKSDPESPQNRRISIVLRKRKLDRNKQGIEDRRSAAGRGAGKGGSTVQGSRSGKNAANKAVSQHGTEVKKLMSSVGAMLEKR